jgi:hypothetical protein
VALISRSEDEAQQRAVRTVGVALISGTAILAGAVWLIQKTAQSKGLHIILTHDASPELRDMFQQITPRVDTLLQEGIHIRLGAPKRPKRELLGALASNLQKR